VVLLVTCTSWHMFRVTPTADDLTPWHQLGRVALLATCALQPDDQWRSSLPSVGEGGSHQPTEIRRGWASFAFGNVSVSTPSSSCALIRS
jgi:hypothetical protein